MDIETIDCLEKALDLNLRIQRDLLKRLQQISLLKIKLSTKSENRRNRLTFETRRVAKSCNETNASEDHIGKNRKRKKNSQGKEEILVVPRKIAKGWEFNESRKWTRRFFIDIYHYVPTPNKDTIKRREWEGDLIGLGSHRYNPWSKEELHLLKQSTEKVRLQQQQSNSVNMDNMDNFKRVKDCDINFDKVTELIKSSLAEKKYDPNQIRKIQAHSYSSADDIDHTLELRLSTDYRNKFLYSISDSINKSRFSKEESLQMLDSIKEQGCRPSWDVIAKTINNSRTPFQCFQYVEKKISETVGTLNKNEDELLLKFIAASGPQLVIGHNITTFLSRHFFPHLSTKQLLTRVNTSLVNPNFRNERWSDFEERMLVLGMKSYCNDDHAISKVAVSYLYWSSFVHERMYFKGFLYLIFLLCLI